MKSGKLLDIGLLNGLVQGADRFWIEPIEVCAGTIAICRGFLQENEHAPASGRCFPVQSAGGIKRYIIVGMVGGHSAVVAQCVVLMIDAQIGTDILFFFPQTAVSSQGNSKCLQHGCPGQHKVNLLSALYNGFAKGELLCDELGMV